MLSSPCQGAPGVQLEGIEQRAPHRARVSSWASCDYEGPVATETVTRGNCQIRSQLLGIGPQVAVEKEQSVALCLNWTRGVAV